MWFIISLIIIRLSKYVIARYSQSRPSGKAIPSIHILKNLPPVASSQLPTTKRAAKLPPMPNIQKQTKTLFIFCKMLIINILKFKKPIMYKKKSKNKAK